MNLSKIFGACRGKDTKQRKVMADQPYTVQSTQPTKFCPRDGDDVSTTGKSDTEDEDADNPDRKAERLIDKSWDVLINYLKPDPLLGYNKLEENVIGYQENKRIQKEKYTTEKNRQILALVRQKGMAGYTNLKQCMRSASQIKLVGYLDCVERGKDASILLDQIKVEAIRELKKDFRERRRYQLWEDYGWYKELIQNFQNELVLFYRSRHTRMPLSPLSDQETSFLEFFVMPDLVKVKEWRQFGSAREERIPLGPARNIFYNRDDESRRSIFITADAGMGKTVFSKYLTLAWCQAIKPLKDHEQYFTQEVIEAVSGFTFVFLLLLRESPNECDIDNLIIQEIMSQLVNTYISLGELEEILYRKSKSLVILDGWDEWTHPENGCIQPKVRRVIPHKKAAETMSVLTTSRPWRFSTARLKSSEVDIELELLPLRGKSANELKCSVLTYLMRQHPKLECVGRDDSEIVNLDVEEFNKEVAKNNLSDLETVPSQLMYLLFLWHYNKELGETQCELYSNIVEHMLSQIECDNIVLPSPGNLPPCFKGREHCQEFSAQLTALGHLAFETLLLEVSELNKIEFDLSVALKYLGRDYLQVCLKAGILTRRRLIQTDILREDFNVSFLLKTIQDFFAVLYMYYDPDGCEVPTHVLSKCTCIEDILRMSKLLVFISGMNMNVAALISRESMKIINQDELTQKYRNSHSSGNDFIANPLKVLQDMNIMCCREVSSETEVSLCLQDVFIDESCNEDRYSRDLQLLTTINKSNIISVYIDMYSMQNPPFNSVQKIIEYFALNDLENLEKVYLHCADGHIDDIFPLLNRQVKCLTLTSGCLGSSLSRSLCEKVASLQKLEAIYIGRFLMSHGELRLLYDSISQRDSLREVQLWDLTCADHMRSCTGHRLNLSQHSQLRKLSLKTVPLAELTVNITLLENYDLWRVSLPAPVFHSVTVQADGKLSTSSVRLYNIRIPAAVLSDLVNKIQTLPQTVCVQIAGCVIAPRGGFETLKYGIRTSPNFKMLEDERDSFSFETKKDLN